ncbi:alpha-1,4-glucan--maltose-1-phosphate maltosyltransferase [Pigmentiphaga soli]|uniref:Alpha-1,4-glucan:maltose-1-phosphate maltosyltransferase n=1 Tax=Pigmentiphaga soli TaxID=1007095 RepID=A0ABP8H6Y6_9BURK
MTDRRHSLPRIYDLSTRHLGAIRTDQAEVAPPWADALDRAAGLGFAQALAAIDDAADAAPLAAACRARGLELWVRLCPAEVVAGSEAARALPSHYPPPPAGDGALDPRRPIDGAVRIGLAWHDDATAAWTDYWAGHLAALAAAGAAGFLFLLPHGVPAAGWRALRARRDGGGLADCRLAAWTPGVPRAALAGLREAGFDTVFGSLAWWDFRSGWLWEEYRALDVIGRVAAFPASPFDPGAADVPGDPAQRSRAARRALWASAALGQGWLVPMGFELGGPAGAAGQGAGADIEPGGALDLAADLRAANAWLARLESGGARLRPLTGVDAPATAIWREQAMDSRQAMEGEPAHAAWLVLINPDLHLGADVDWAALAARLPGAAQHRGAQGTSITAAEAGSLPPGLQALEPGEVRIVMLEPAEPVVLLARPTRPQLKKRLAAALQAPRVAIENVEPTVDGGRFALKRTPGQPVAVQADIFMDGHDKIAAAVLWRPADSREWRRAPMAHVGNDRWQGSFAAERVGMHYFAVEAWRDTFATYRDELSKKRAAGVDVTVELEEVRRWTAGVLEAAQAADDEALRADAGAALARLRGRDPAGLPDWILSDAAAALIARADPRGFASRSAEFPVNVERRAAEFASWYELFPRSQSGDPARHGTFDDVIARLPEIRDLGFDVLYFPPIHPIGRKNRKGRNNSLSAQPGDPGSPYAIGSEEGGHDAIHPQLGTLEDFRRLVAAAREHGLEIALDFAIQCSPDHPWLRDHPEWFAWRADGSLRYAENPPKKYEDIVNVDFYAEDGGDAAAALWNALRDVVLMWAREGVRTFRVDNPHTKPLPFWEWLIAEVQGRYPDTVFLSEAFTRPKVMYRLAKLGFSQSYTYFTWRERKQELAEYLLEVSSPPVADHFRPHFFVNTPDINPRFLQSSGRAGFLIRAALAATGSGLWGMYSGFELCEAAPVPGKEEYLDSEKYEIRAWDWDRPGHIKAEIAALNRIRRDQPALQSHRGLGLVRVDNDALLAYTRFTPERDNVVLVAVSLDPFAPQGGTAELPLWEFGLPDDGTLQAQDLLEGHRFAWHGKFQYLRLEPGRPYAIWRISLRA